LSGTCTQGLGWFQRLGCHAYFEAGFKAAATVAVLAACQGLGGMSPWWLWWPLLTVTGLVNVASAVRRARQPYARAFCRLLQAILDAPAGTALLNYETGNLLVAGQLRHGLILARERPEDREDPGGPPAAWWYAISPAAGKIVKTYQVRAGGDRPPPLDTRRARWRAVRQIDRMAKTPAGRVTSDEMDELAADLAAAVPASEGEGQ
jgi:hypothetical protein